MDLKEIYRKALSRLGKEEKNYEKEVDEVKAKIETENAKKVDLCEEQLEYLENNLDETKRALSDVRRNIGDYLQKFNSLGD